MEGSLLVVKREGGQGCGAEGLGGGEVSERTEKGGRKRERKRKRKHL